ncbi:hypothetical protein CFAM422_001007 [Trichoderma lentiforme]|uniref:NACHT domain-containing protein n=1 Tax=Trichoderma lentiforme TaxID=1567552 RepID=A0A9P4XRJ2_9HYPO|nr:hypothetical protein CFAM422_001007 [Trichoderma lentiforme]
MATDKVSRPTSRDEFEIAIVCTRALEYDAICLLLDGFWDIDGDPFGRAQGDLNTYTTGYMGKYNIVVVLLCNSGKANAASTSASLRSSYPRIELLLLTGICEGVPDANGEELLLGDVVISETVIQYDLNSPFNNALKRRNTLEDRQGRANNNIRKFIANFKTEMGLQRLEEKATLHLEQIQSLVSEAKYRQRRKGATYIYPGFETDILFESTHCHRHYNSSQCVCADYNPEEDLHAVCDEARDLDCEQTGCELSSLKHRDRLHQKSLLEDGDDLKSAQIPSIFFGRFGSGDTAFNSGVHRDSLAKTHGIVAFEMEGAGVWDELPCIIVKGVSDYGDGHKTRKWAEWQNFAAATAASVARALIERYPQTDKSPVTELKADAVHSQLQENKTCLDALFITNPEDDKQRIEDTKGGLLLDAYIWIMRNEEFMQWLEDPETRLLWIKGDPGKGKTMLLCGIINELKSANPRGNIYYFLCQATDGRLNNASAILRGLLHMMIVQQPSLISYIRDEYNHSGKSAFEGINSWVVLSRVLEQMLKDDSLNESILVIDALDECMEDLTQLLEIIMRNSSSSSQVKWLVSSRNEADIQGVLAAAENKSTVSLELNAESVSTAIATYIRHKVQLLADKKGYTQPTRERVERYLSDNASGTFLWVALVCALLDKAPRYDPLPKSAEFPLGLDQLYERMISRVCDPSTSDIGRKVLAIATVAYRPLTKEELVPLINNCHHKEIMRPSEYDWEDMLGHCGSFLTMRSDTIYFVHQSAKDFLTKEGSQRLFPNGMEYVHGEIFEASIVAMRNILRKDIYSLVDPTFSMDNLAQHTLSNDPLIPIKYSCVYWIDHFAQSIFKTRTVTHDSFMSHELLYAFLKEKFIYWLEALSLLGGIYDGIAGMKRLEQLVVDSRTPELLKLVRDACKFIQAFSGVIADYPLQVYVSALTFSPSQSLTRYQFKKQAPKWIQSLAEGETEWTAASRTYESSKHICGLAVSCCGTWIASRHLGATVTIWETYSGKIIRVLDALLGVSLTEKDESPSFRGVSLDVHFSPWNRRELVSGYCERLDYSQFVIWNVTTGKALQQLRIKNDVVTFSYLSSAPHLLGFVSQKRRDSEDIEDYYNDNGLTASIWNTKTGERIKKIQLQISSPSPVSPIFSPTDDNTIAWYIGPHVEIINIDTASTIQIPTDTIQIPTDTIQIPTDTIGYIAGMEFSPDGSSLAIHKRIRSTSSEPSISVIILSDVSSGEIEWSYQSEGYLHDVSFSPDGKLLAISGDHGVELISTVSGKCLRKIRIMSRCLVFSSDGSKMYSADSSAISVIDTDQESFATTGAGDNSLGQKIIDRRCMSLSPDGKLIASVFANNPVIEVMEIGSTNSTYYLKILDPIQEKLRKLLFSPDSRKLFVLSRNGFITWDISSKPAKLIFKWINSHNLKFWVPSFVLSLDGKRIAFKPLTSGTYDLTYVQVWDTGSKNCLLNLQSIPKYLEALRLCFSPDNRQLAILHRDRDFGIKVEIWDIASVSATQAINLSWHDLHGNFQNSNPGPEPWNPPDEGGQEDEKTPEEVKEEVPRNKEGDVIAQAMFRIAEVYFIEKGSLIVDLLPEESIRNQIEGIRVALQTEKGRELTGETSSMIRFKEAKSYELESGKTWIKFNGKRLVWLPPQYRTEFISCERNRLVVPHLGGSLSIIQLSYHKELAQQMSYSHTSTAKNTPRVSDTETFTYLRELGDGWKIITPKMNAPDDTTMHKTENVDEIKDISEVAHEDITENYRYWKWTILGF